jgi:WD40 repeat protein
MSSSSSSSLQQQQQQQQQQKISTLEVMELTAESQAQRTQQQAVRQQLEVQRHMSFAATTVGGTTAGGTAGATKMAAVVVPTLPADVRAALRQLGLPVRLFGENLADVRQRLRLELATQQVLVTAGAAIIGEFQQQDQDEKEQHREREQEQAADQLVTKYTRATSELLQARQAICVFSLQRAAARLARERQQRAASAQQQQQKRKRQQHQSASAAATTTTTTTTTTADDDETTTKDTPRQDENTNSDNTDIMIRSSSDHDRMEEACRKTYQSCRQLCLTASQFGDVRALSAICAAAPIHNNTITHNNNRNEDILLATASWTGSIHLWNGSTAAMSSLGSRVQCHVDRIMWMDVMTSNNNNNNSSTTSNEEESCIMLATASIDMTAKLWKIQKKNSDVVMKERHDDEKEDISSSSSTSSYDIVELQHFQGHAARLCRTAFHPMHRHVGTTSFDYTWRLWDLETGQNLLLQDGHAREVFGLAFHVDGSLCCTTDFASVVQLWDLRTGKSIQHYAATAGSSQFGAAAAAAGHAKRVTCCDFSPNGIHLATAGDDGTIKIWDLRKRPTTTIGGVNSHSLSARVAKNALIANIPAHSRLVTRVKFQQQPNNDSGGGGEFLVSSSFDGLAKVWSARDWKLLKELQGHTGQVSCVDILPSFSASSSSSSSGGGGGGSGGGVGIVTCGFDKTLKLWQ